VHMKGGMDTTTLLADLEAIRLDYILPLLD
jgi:hypothetical protein